MVSLRRALIAAALVVVALFATTATASAQPEGDGQIGFRAVCEVIDGIEIPFIPFAGELADDACKIGNAVTHPVETVTALRDKAWDSTFGKVVDSLLSGLGDALILSMTWWTKIPSSTTVSDTSLFTSIRSYTFHLQILLLAMSLIICGIRLAIAHRGAAAEHATEAFRVLARAIFASAAFSTVITLGTQASDQFALWLINTSTDQDARGVAEAMVQTAALTALSPGLVFAIALVGMVGALMQAVFAVVREALLILVVGVLPLAAASSGTHSGRAFHDRLLGWSIAFVLYKPVAALIYMIAFKTAGSSAQEISKTVADGQVPSTDQAQQVLVGIVLLCSAALVLPALMRLITPLTALGGGISGASAAAGMLGAAAGMGGGGVGRATGAKSTPAGTVSRPGGGGANSGGGRGGGGNGGSGTGTGSRPAPAPAPPPPPSSGGVAGAGRGPAGAASAAGGGRTSAAMTASKGAGPVGAAAVGAAKAVGAGVRAVESSVSAAATPPPPVARPTGAGRAAVPR